tara:strand:+ start:4104 stop:5114 length:1011 start_codon:yes stop_codon:yes gene_type:complete
MLDKLPIEIANRINKYVESTQSKIEIVKTTNAFNLKKDSDLIANLAIVNNIRRINKFHEIVNKSLNQEGIYLSCSETLEERRTRVRAKTPFGFKNIVRTIDFIYKRVIPKLPIFKNIYFSLTGGNNRVISKPETLGRIISCGFSVLEYFEYNNLLYVISKKIKEPDYNMRPSYGPLFKMNRVGYEGKIIGVYKFRTMYPYSEYCQDMITKENKLASSGKVFNDFRITTWGKLFRKFWIDEIPMFINFFKLELNLVGVRPLSKNYFMKYPKELRDLRIKFKPGLIPPYYADLPENFEQILDSERNYLESKINNPIITDVRYFFRAFINIIFRGARSS